MHVADEQSPLGPLRALGNGQVPAVAALAWRELTARIDSHTMEVRNDNG